MRCLTFNGAITLFQSTRHWILIGTFAGAVAANATPLPAVDAQVAPVFGLRAGTSIASQVEAVLGTPLAKRDTYRYEYRAAKGADDLASVICEYFPEGQLARLDAYLKTPLPAAMLRARFGQVVLRRQRSDGKAEEFYYPNLNALVYSPDQPDQVIAIGYLSTRALADVFVDLSNDAIADKRDGDAREAVDNAVATDPDYARGYLAQGILFYNRKDFNEAIVRFTAATHARYTAHKQGQAHAWLGVVYGKVRNQQEQARQEFQNALRMAGDYDMIHLLYGGYLRWQKQDSQAEAEYKEALRLNPNGAEAHGALASIYVNRNAWAQAQPHLKFLADWADTPAAAHQPTQRVWAYSRYAYSVGQSQGERSRFANDHNLAQISIANYQKALRLAGGDAFSSLNLGLEYDYDEEPYLAAQAYRQGIAANPKHLEMNQNLADMLVELRSYDEARRQAEVALALKPDDVYQMMNLARAYGGLHKRPDAETWIRKAVAGGYRTNMDAFSLEDGYFDGTISDDDLRALLEGRR